MQSVCLQTFNSFLPFLLEMNAMLSPLFTGTCTPLCFTLFHRCSILGITGSQNDVHNKSPSYTEYIVACILSSFLTWFKGRNATTILFIVDNRSMTTNRLDRNNQVDLTGYTSHFPSDQPSLNPKPSHSTFFTSSTTLEKLVNPAFTLCFLLVKCQGTECHDNPSHCQPAIFYQLTRKIQVDLIAQPNWIHLSFPIWSAFPKP